MHLALITDLHYGIRNDSSVFYTYQKKSNDFFFKTLRERNITQIICLGDLVHRTKYINYVTAARCRADFLNIVNTEFKMDIILGNHDIYHKNVSDINALNALVVDRYKNINCYANPITKSYDDVEILLMPWINDTNYDMSLETIKNTSAQICFGHLELVGFEMDKGVINHAGQNANIFSKFDMVCSGHFHHKSSKDNINYLGAAYEFTWADWNDPRGFTIFDTDTRTIEFIQNPYTMFKMIVYDDVNDPEKIKNDIKNGTFLEYRDSYIKIVAVKKTDPHLFDQFLDAIYKAEPQDITVVEDSSLFTEENDNELINQGEDTMTIFRRYIDNLTINVEKNKLKDMVKQIYMEAITTQETHDA